MKVALSYKVTCAGVNRWHITSSDNKDVCICFSADTAMVIANLMNGRSTKNAKKKVEIHNSKRSKGTGTLRY